MEAFKEELIRIRQEAQSENGFYMANEDRFCDIVFETMVQGVLQDFVMDKESHRLGLIRLWTRLMYQDSEILMVESYREEEKSPIKDHVFMHKFPGAMFCTVCERDELSHQ